ncbi:MAG: hypothetical protein NUK57_02300 [Gudongella sp.]|nr:hypothetical protein [Gudongella sp.]
MSNQRKGISLIELVLTIALVGIFTQVIYSVFFIGNASHKYSTNLGFAQQDTRYISDFLTKELRYVTNMTDNIEMAKGETNFYSLEVEKIDDVARIKRTYYEYAEGTEDTYDPIDVETIDGKWSSIKIKNISVDLVDIEISQSEGNGNSEANYNLPLNIDLGNSAALLTNVDLDLMADDGSPNILYYQKAIDANIKSKIDFVLDDSDEGDDSEESDSIVWNNVNPITLNSLVIKEGNTIHSPSVNDNIYTFSTGSSNSKIIILEITINRSTSDNQGGIVGVTTVTTLNDASTTSGISNPQIDQDGKLSIEVNAGKEASMSFDFKYDGNPDDGKNFSIVINRNK